MRSNQMKCYDGYGSEYECRLSDACPGTDEKSIIKTIKEGCLRSIMPGGNVIGIVATKGKCEFLKIFLDQISDEMLQNIIYATHKRCDEYIQGYRNEYMLALFKHINLQRVSNIVLIEMLTDYSVINYTPLSFQKVLIDIAMANNDTEFIQVVKSLKSEVCWVTFSDGFGEDHWREKRYKGIHPEIIRFVTEA